MASSSKGEEGLPEKFVRNIAEHCPDAGMVPECLRSDPTNILGILGPQIGILRLDQDFVPAMPDFEVSLWTECTSVTSLAIGLKTVEVFLATKRPKLKKLFLTGANPMDAYADTLTRVAQNTGGLNEINLEGPAYIDQRG